MDDITTADARDALEAILGNVAGDYFEGWPNYWNDEGRFRDEMMALLRGWEAICQHHATPPPPDDTKADRAGSPQGGQ